MGSKNKKRRRKEIDYVRTSRSLLARTSLAARSRAVDNTPIAGIVAPEWRDHAPDPARSCTRSHTQLLHPHNPVNMDALKAFTHKGFKGSHK